LESLDTNLAALPLYRILETLFFIRALLFDCVEISFLSVIEEDEGVKISTSSVPVQEVGHLFHVDPVVLTVW